MQTVKEPRTRGEQALSEARPVEGLAQCLTPRRSLELTTAIVVIVIGVWDS